MELYRDYFIIDEEYFPQVNAAVINKNPDIWKKFFPHASFIKLLKDTVSILSRQQKVSVWVEGAYGTGKSHAVLTLKKLLDASEEDTRAYFTRYDLDKDLQNKFQSIKNSGRILTVHRYGSSNIHGDNDLVLAIQESVEQAFIDAGIENKGTDSLKQATINWLSDVDNKFIFNTLITGTYASLFGGDNVDAVIQKLNSYTDESLHLLMGKIFQVAKERQIKAFSMSTTDLCNWLKETIRVNNLKAIVFIWDEFTEFFSNNMRSLTGFQEIAEISATDPFYLMIVTHKSSGLFSDADKDKNKILDRFVKPTCIIELPEHIAFQLMGAAMEKNKDAQVYADYQEAVEDLYDRTSESRALVRKSTHITDDELKEILPIHPYAALLLKHISSAFDSNARSMFDFIKNDRGEEIKGFQWYINNYGPLDENPLLTVDMLWDFFYEKGKEYLSQDIRSTLDCYNQAAAKHLSSDGKRIMKAILLLQAISQKVGDSVELFMPNEKNLNHAFEGSDLEGGRAARCAEQLVRDKVIFKKELGGGKFLYSAFSRNDVDPGKIAELEDTVRNKATSAFVTEGSFTDLLDLPAALRLRYVIISATANDFETVIKRIRGQELSRSGKIPAVITFAKNDAESVALGKKIAAAVKDGSYDIVFVDASLTSFGKDAFDQYVHNKARAMYFSGKDDAQSRAYDGYAAQNLKSWKQQIGNGEFLLYTKDKASYERVQNMDALYEALKAINRSVYPCCLEEYSVIDGMWAPSSLKSGAECGAKQETSGTFKSANPMTKLENALDGAWKIERYWEVKPHLLISKIKLAVEAAIQKDFAAEGRISIARIYGLLKEKPFGFMPCNLSAFVLGFVLKEYVDGTYTWSDGLTNDTLSILKLKEMIDEVMKLDITANPRYKDKFIVTMTAEEKKFNEVTAEAFGISRSLCSSVEQTRERIRAKMREFSFPIWVLRSIVPDVTLKTDRTTITELIDHYCGIANNNNSAISRTESDIALLIGKICISNPFAAEDLKTLLTKDNCTNGMKAYLQEYSGGVLPALAVEIGDNGQYINVLRKKFDADAANWVWNIETANQKIDEVILEYRIIAESNKIISKNITFDNTIREWTDKCNHIKISYLAAKNYFGALGPFMEMLYGMKRSGTLLDSQKKKFLELLASSGEEFRNFYNNQVVLFKQICSFYVEEFSDDEVRELFATFGSGLFTREKSEYTTFVSNAVQSYKGKQETTKLRNLWKQKTGSDSPRAWSNQYSMPILAMVPSRDAHDARNAFGALNRSNPDPASVKKAIEFLTNAAFYDDLNSTEKRDDAFRRCVIKIYNVMLTNVEEVKQYLTSRMSSDPYDWFGLPEVDEKLKKMAEAKYNETGCDRALEKIDSMDITEVKRYLKDLIKDNMLVGMEIIKNN